MPSETRTSYFMAVIRSLELFLKLCSNLPMVRGHDVGARQNSGVNVFMCLCRAVLAT
jgi:hypothetical protein